MEEIVAAIPTWALATIYLVVALTIGRFFYQKDLKESNKNKQSEPDPFEYLFMGLLWPFILFVIVMMVFPYLICQTIITGKSPFAKKRINNDRSLS